MVREAKDWPWSSYRQTSGLLGNDSLLVAEWLLSAFSKKRGTAQKKYIEFVNQGKNGPSPWEALKNQVFLGDEAYVSQIMSNIDQDKDLSEIPKSQRKAKTKELQWYEQQQATSRNDAIKHSYESGGYSMKEIGTYYNLHYSRVGRIIKKEKDKTRHQFCYTLAFLMQNQRNILNRIAKDLLKESLTRHLILVPKNKYI